MKGIKKGLAILLVLCTLLSMVAMTGAAAPQSDDTGDAQTMAAESGASDFLRIFSLDCGRIYFSVDQIKGIIDELATCGYTHLQLAFGNSGMRFLLEDMSVTVGDTTYGSEAVKTAIQAGNTYYAANDGHGGSQAANTCLTQAEMDGIISYASNKGIRIIPLLNSPGHMNAIVYAMGQLDISNAGYPMNEGNSPSTVNINNDTAKEFATALIQKYITYFAGKGCTYFHMGADEFANDPTDGTNKLGFSKFDDTLKRAFVSYVNDIASMIIQAGMTPVMFNDGYAWTNAGFNTSIVVSYWTSGSVSSTQIANEGHQIINTNQAWYYVLGSPFGTAQGNWCSYASATNGVTNTQVTSLVDNESIGGKLVGATMCLWCDFTNKTYTLEEQTNVATLIRTLATNNPTYFTVQQKETITVVRNGTKEVGVSSDKITEQPDSTYASVVIEPTEMTTGKYVQVDSIESGKQYILVNQGVYVTNTTTNSRNVSGLTCESFSASDTAGSYNASLWTITETNGGYTIKNANGKYLNVASSSGNADVTLTETAQTLTISDLGTTFTIANGRTYFDRFDEDFAAGWGGDGAGSSNPNEKWALYEYQEAPAYTMTVTGNAIGTTYVTVGNVRYTIHVTAEDLSTVTPLTVHMYISTNPVWDRETGLANNGTPPSGAATSVSVSAAKAYGAGGIELASVVPEVGAWAWASNDAPTVYWKGVVLHGIQQSSTQSEDYSMQGTDYYYIRYYGGNWQYSADRTTWHTVNANDEVDAYYLMKTTVSREVDTYVKDWAYTTNTASGQDEGRYQKALSFAVVYPNGQLSPSTEEEIYSNSTLIYWDNLNPLTFIRVGVNEVYEVEKITYTFGTRSNPNETTNWGTEDSINWQKVTIEENKWYDETICWDESYGTEPVVNGADLATKIYANGNGITNFTGTWGKDDAVLILIYLKPVVTEDSLTVRYWDDSANSEIYSYPVNITNTAGEAAGTFLNRLVQTSAVNTGEFTLDENAYVVNAKNQNETFQKDLTMIPSLFGKYTSGLYDYAKAEISADGKTLTLHYNLDSSKLSKNYVVDFGLPVEIPFADLVKDPSTIQSVTVAAPANGTATVDTANEVIRYAPDCTYTGVVTLSVTVTFKGGMTQVFSVGITPATTVYYEEGFAVPYPADTENVTTEGPAQNLTQTTSVVGSKAHYGYDDAYASPVGDSNGTAMKLAAGAGAATFTFTGTGVDIYTSSTTDTGSLMIRVVASNGALVKVLSVNTVMQNGSTDATTGQNVTAAYNVPVVSLSGLAHGTYTLQIAAVKSGSAGAKEVYLDGFRVYGTLEDQANEVYKADLEDSPTFIELRDEVLTAQNVSTDGSQYANQIAENVISQVHAVSNSTTGAVIMSNNPKFNDADMQDLLDNGPKNEIYLQQGQALTFTINTKRVVQVGLKALNQATGYEIKVGEQSVASNMNFSASTDMFYTVLNKTDSASEQTITITNNGTGILSITKLKVCDDPNATLGELTAEDLIPALVSLGYETEPVEAEAVLNITVQAGDQTVTAQLTATGIEGESHTFTAAEIKAAAEAALPEGYTLDGVSFEDVTVVCGAQGETSYTAAAVQNPTPDQPTKVLQKLLAVIKNIFKRLFRWL